MSLPEEVALQVRLIHRAGRSQILTEMWKGLSAERLTDSTERLRLGNDLNRA